MIQDGEKIRRLRNQKGVSIETMALAIDMSSKQLGRIERMDSNTVQETLSSIADYLEVQYKDLLNTPSPGGKDASDNKLCSRVQWSALTWEWFKNHATTVIPSLSGRIWWSLYEKETSIEKFVRHALAYITGRDLEQFSGDELTYFECLMQLRVELKRQPYLLVLDGFERVLTAYHRWDMAHDATEPQKTMASI